MVDLAPAALRRNPGAALSAAGAVLLVGAMFLDWYVVDVSGGRVPGAERLARTAGVDAWQVFAWVDLLLFAAAVVAVASALLGDSAPPLLAPRLVVAGAALAAGVVLWRLVDPPLTSGEAFTFTVDVVVKPGAFLGLGGALMIAAGGVLRMRTAG